ncbi:MAG: hypothetical protein H6867_01215 [Rhodospirillales bacterium]|nr:hypothetical protein [Rhodospirillales bacterium]MCB9997135.1 hypothetical protein [Rhodospirillales bacterium]
MADLEKETYSKQEVQDLIRAELKTVRTEYGDLKQQVNKLNDDIVIQKKDYDLLKLHMARLADHIEKRKMDGTGIGCPDREEVMREIKEVGRYIDKAIGAVIARAEKMEKLVAGYVFSEKDRLLEEITHIFEACDVQDLTAQRIKKVLELMGDQEATAKKEAKVDPDSILLEHGPQMPDEAMSQAEIDKMLKDL